MLGRRSLAGAVGVSLALVAAVAVAPSSALGVACSLSADDSSTGAGVRNGPGG